MTTRADLFEREVFSRTCRSHTLNEPESRQCEECRRARYGHGDRRAVGSPVFAAWWRERIRWKG